MENSIEKSLQEEFEEKLKNIEKEVIEFEKWEHRDIPDEDLKQIAKDLYHGKIFSDRHLSQHDSLEGIFMPLMFFGLDTIDTSTREGKVKSLLKEYAENEYFKSIGTTKEDARQKYYNNIGFIYEYIDKAGSMAVNGMPTFLSMRLLNLKDTEKMFGYYEKYKNLLENIDNQL